MVKSRVKSLATPCVTELDRWKVGRENRFFSYNFAKHGLAKVLIIYLITRDHPRSKPHSPWPAGVGGPWNLKNHWISPTLIPIEPLHHFTLTLISPIVIFHPVFTFRYHPILFSLIIWYSWTCSYPRNNKVWGRTRNVPGSEAPRTEIPTSLKIFH